MQGVKLRVKQQNQETVEYFVPRGENLRAFLLRVGHALYSGKNQVINCRGFGLCGTCWVAVKETDGEFSRRSCQIQCYQDYEIQLQ